MPRHGDGLIDGVLKQLTYAARHRCGTHATVRQSQLRQLEASGGGDAGAAAKPDRRASTIGTAALRKRLALSSPASFSASTPPS